MRVLSAGGKRSVEELDDTKRLSLLDDWKRACDDVEATSPDNAGSSSSSSTVLKVKTGGFRLPGLTLETTATIGANLIATTDESALRRLYSSGGGRLSSSFIMLS